MKTAFRFSKSPWVIKINWNFIRRWSLAYIHSPVMNTPRPCTVHRSPDEYPLLHGYHLIQYPVTLIISNGTASVVSRLHKDWACKYNIEIDLEAIWIEGDTLTRLTCIPSKLGINSCPHNPGCSDLWHSNSEISFLIAKLFELNICGTSWVNINICGASWSVGDRVQPLNILNLYSNK